MVEIHASVRVTTEYTKLGRYHEVTITEEDLKILAINKAESEYYHEDGRNFEVMDIEVTMKG